MFPSKRHARRYIPHLENLEDRCCPSASIFQSGQTLAVFGDNADNHITVVQSDRGVQIAINDAAAQTFTGISRIYVASGDGNDTVNVGYAFRGQTGVAAADVYVRLGAGTDT